VVRTEKSVGLLRERACRWHQCCSFALDGDFGCPVFKGNYIIRDLTCLRNSNKMHNVSNWLEPEA
jgi:hypothetical protein